MATLPCIVQISVLIFLLVINWTVQAMRLRDVDAKIQREEFIDPETLCQYLKDIRTAESGKLLAADVILCTCATSAANRIRKNSNIVQVKPLQY